MRIKPQVAMLASAAGALAIAVPAAAAHPGPNHHNNGKGKGNANHPAQSHKCKPRDVGYVVSGTVDGASTLAPNLDGTWSGMLVVDAPKTNHWAKGTTGSFTFTSAKLSVRFDGGTTVFKAGERVKLIGKLDVVSKNCPALSPPASPEFRMVVVHPAKS
jgi:hypothetical protein